LLGKHELAIGTATMAVELSDSDVTNASAHHCRAQVNTSMYMRVSFFIVFFALANDNVIALTDKKSNHNLLFSLFTL